MDFKELKDFIKSVAKSGVTEVDIKTEKMKLNIKVPAKGKAAVTHTETVIQQVPMATSFGAPMHMAPAPVQQVAPVATEQKTETEPEGEDTSKYITIKAPMVGTMYRKPAPEKPAFVNVGDPVQEDTVVCIIEAMKLFNEIESEVSGKIVKVLVDDQSPVEFDQPLFLVDPS